MKFLTFFQLIFLFASSAVYSQSITVNTTPSVIESYDAHRQAFIDGKLAELERFLEKKKNVSHSEELIAKQAQVREEEIRLKEFEKRLDQKIADQNSEKSRLQALVDEAQHKIDTEQSKIDAERAKVRSARDSLVQVASVRAGLLTWFFPVMGLGANVVPMLSGAISFSDFGGVPAIAFFAFFSVWAITIFITLWNKEHAFMGRNKWIMFGLLILFISTFSAPLYAQNKIEEDEFISQLRLVDQILVQSDYQRYIAILELKPQKQIKLPNLDASGIYLRPFRTVKVDSGEYHFTLGSLYEHENRVGDAVAAIKKIKVGNLASASRNPVINASIKFLIDHHQTDAASTLLADSLKQLDDVSSLVDLALFLDSKGMQASSDDILERAISIADQYEEFVELTRVFHQNGSIEKAGDAMDRAITSSDTSLELIELSKLASELNFPDKSSTALSRAIEKASNSDDLIKLSQYATQINNAEKSILALQKALDRVKTPEELLKVASAAIDERHDDIIDGVNSKVDGILDEEARLELVDLYRKHKHTEDAVEVFEALLDTITKNDPDKQERLLHFADLAIEREMYEQARNAIERLARLSGKQRNSILVSPNQSLSVVENIPVKNAVELQLYYGLLNELMNFNDKAEGSYKNSVKRSLQEILESYGYDTPNNLNNFYLLGRIWKALGQLQKLEPLDLVYTDIEKEILKKTRTNYENKLSEIQLVMDKQVYKDLDKEIKQLAKYEAHLLKRERNDVSNVQRSIDGLQAKIASLKKRLPEKIQQLADYRPVAKQEKKEILLEHVSAVAAVCFLLLLLIGSINWAYEKHAKHLNTGKTFGFIAKYIEVMGWLRVLAIVGVVSGMISIVIGQLMQIFQRSSEELAKQNRQLLHVAGKPFKEVKAHETS